MKIDDKFYIDDSDLTNYTLKERCKKKSDKTGEIVDYEKVHGYFGNVGQALGRYVDARVHAKAPEDLRQCLAELKAIRGTINVLLRGYRDECRKTAAPIGGSGSKDSTVNGNG